MSKQTTKAQIADARRKLKKELVKIQKQLDLITPPKKAKSKSYGRTKGLSFERWVAGQMRECGYPKAQRQLEFQVDQAKGTDIRDCGEWKIQCKKYANYVSPSVINEVKCRGYMGDVAVLVTAGTNRPPLVVLKFHDFKEIVKRLKEIEG